MKITMKLAARFAGVVIAIAASGCAEGTETPTLLASAPIGNATTTDSAPASAHVTRAASVTTTERLSDPKILDATSEVVSSRNVVRHSGPIRVERAHFQVEASPHVGGPGPISRMRR